MNIRRKITAIIVCAYFVVFANSTIDSLNTDYHYSLASFEEVNRFIERYIDVKSEQKIPKLLEFVNNLHSTFL